MPAAPRNFIEMLEGMPMSFAAVRMAATDLPSAMPGAVSKPTVAAGYCATRVTCSGASCSRTVAKEDRGVVEPPPVRICSVPRPWMDASPSRCASRITRYWLVSVKMVETMRWPKAL